MAIPPLWFAGCAFFYLSVFCGFQFILFFRHVTLWPCDPESLGMSLYTPLVFWVCGEFWFCGVMIFTKSGRALAMISANNCFSVTFSLILSQCQVEWLWTLSQLDAVFLVFLWFPVLGIKGRGSHTPLGQCFICAVAPCSLRCVSVCLQFSSPSIHCSSAQSPPLLSPLLSNLRCRALSSWESI